MAVGPNEMLLYAGGEVLERHGVLLKRTAPWEEIVETHSRASTATFRNRDRVLKSAESGAVRTEWVEDESGLLVPATLLEGQRTNELTRSEELDHGDWTKTNASVTADQETGPDGEVSLDEIVEDGTASVNHAVTQAATLTANANYALSVWVIANTRTFIRLQVEETAAGGNAARAWFDLSDGTVGTTSAIGTGAVVRAYVRDYTNVAAGLYRCVLVGSVNNSATGITARLALASADGITSYNGDGSSSLYAGYAQLEDDAEFASSYTPTTSSAVTRSADSLYVDYPHAPQETTVQAKFVEGGTVFAGNFVGLWKIGDAASSDPRFQVRRDSGNERYEALHDNGTSQETATTSPAAPSIGDVSVVRAVLHADGSVTLGHAVNGGAESTATSGGTATLGSAWADTRFYLNSRGSPSTGHNAFIYVKVAKGVHSMDAMEAAA